MRWRIYYADGTTIEGGAGTVASPLPWEAPATGVQAVVMETPGGVEPFQVIHSGDAYYWRQDGGWFRCDQLGLWDYLMEYRGPKAVLFGRSMARESDFWAIVKRAQREGLG